MGRFFVGNGRVVANSFHCPSNVFYLIKYLHWVHLPFKNFNYNILKLIVWLYLTRQNGPVLLSSRLSVHLPRCKVRSLVAATGLTVYYVMIFLRHVKWFICYLKKGERYRAALPQYWGTEGHTIPSSCSQNKTPKTILRGLSLVTISILSNIWRLIGRWPTEFTDRTPYFLFCRLDILMIEYQIPSCKSLLQFLLVYEITVRLVEIDFFGKQNSSNAVSINKKHKHFPFLLLITSNAVV